MPLIHGKSKAAREKNIRTEIDAGKPPKQAVAIGYAEQRRNMAQGGDPGDMDAMMDQVAAEMIQAIKSDDHKLMRQALEAFVRQIQQQDQEQDQEMT